MTSGKCLALLTDGSVYLSPAVAVLRYCREHVSLRGMDRARLGQALRQAMRQPDRYLAALLADQAFSTVLKRDFNRRLPYSSNHPAPAYKTVEPPIHRRSFVHAARERLRRGTVALLLSSG